MNYLFNTSVHDQFTAFSEGFHKVMGGHVLVKIFSFVYCRVCKTTCIDTGIIFLISLNAMRLHT